MNKKLGILKGQCDCWLAKRRTALSFEIET